MQSTEDTDAACACTLLALAVDNNFWNSVHLCVMHTLHRQHTNGASILIQNKYVTINVKLVDHKDHNTIPSNVHLDIHVFIVYADTGEMVENEPILCKRIQGKSIFNLRTNALSSKHNNRQFSIKIQPADSRLFAFRALSVRMPPFVCVTKRYLNRWNSCM